MVRNNKYCKKCGTKIDASDNFCEKCGTKISDVKTKERNRTQLHNELKRIQSGTFKGITLSERLEAKRVFEESLSPKELKEFKKLEEREWRIAKIGILIVFLIFGGFLISYNVEETTNKYDKLNELTPEELNKYQYKATPPAKAEYVTQKEKDAGLTDLDIVNWCNDGCRLLFETYAEIDRCVDSCLKEQ